ncbi:MAG: glutaredoxin family protein [Myxococcales bacterium]|nr:glutaredoxin family protein [Myxococcales bacterium]
MPGRGRLVVLAVVGLGLALAAGYAFHARGEPTRPAVASAVTSEPVAAQVERSEPVARAPRAPLPEPDPAPAPRERSVEAAEAEPSPAPAPAGTGRAQNADDLNAAMRAVRITVYTTDWCPHCTRAKDWLRANNIAYTERNVETSESARRERDLLNPRRGVPTADIDGTVLVGFGEANWSRAIARATQRRLEQRR